VIDHLKQSIRQLYANTPFISLLLLIFIFKAPDTILNAMSAPFLHTLGFSKIEYADITKSFGIPLMVLGSLIAGYLVHHLGCLLVVALVIILQTVSCLLFLIQFWVGHDISILFVTVGVESFASGMTLTAFISMISMYCKPPFSAGHYSFLYAVGSMGRVIISSLSGFLADYFGWNWLFFIAALTMIPAFYLLIILRKQFQLDTNQ
jgi:PAT family beta-lactamase induction signal transducer AmpG